jgi:SAM-dependent methyltransferase
MTDIRSYTEANRRAWNEIADVRQRELWPEADFFARGGSLLDPRVTALAGDVRGSRLLHLQCATGEETLSWAVAGADATGVDISERQITLAERAAAEAGLGCRFVAADVYALPSDLQDGHFALVYTGVGVLTWLPDIWQWAAVVAAALRPGGRLILLDGHPISKCLSANDGVLRVAGDYFGRDKPIYGTGWRHFRGGEDAAETKVQFLWPLGDIVTALVRAGMQVEHLEEFPTGAELDLGDGGAERYGLPGEFLLAAQRPE